MENDSFSSLGPKKAARLIAITLERESGEKENSHTAIQELLCTRLAETWSMGGRAKEAWLRALPQWLRLRRSDAERSVRDHLLDRGAPRNAIGSIRRRAKERAARADDENEYAVMTTIYFAAIASRIVFRGQRITTYSYESLQSSFGKLRRKPWMPSDLSELFQKAEEVCRSRAEGSQRSSTAQGNAGCI